MFPPDNVVGNQRTTAYDRAREICAGCPVRDACLEWALLDPDPMKGGIVAGLTPSELSTARSSRTTERRENYVPRCGTEPGYSRHLERGETCAFCLDHHNRRGQGHGD